MSLLIGLGIVVAIVGIVVGVAKRSMAGALFLAGLVLLVAAAALSASGT